MLSFSSLKELAFSEEPDVKAKTPKAAPQQAQAHPTTDSQNNKDARNGDTHKHDNASSSTATASSSARTNEPAAKATPAAVPAFSAPAPAPQSRFFWVNLINFTQTAAGQVRVELAPPRTTAFDLCVATKMMCPTNLSCDAFMLKVRNPTNNQILEMRTDLFAISSTTDAAFDVLVPEFDFSEVLSERSDMATTERGLVDAVLWVPDHDATFCAPCGNYFSLFRRRHHCRRCGGVFCGDCSSKRLLIAGLRKRVCDQCFSEVLSRPPSRSTETQRGMMSPAMTPMQTPQQATTPRQEQVFRSSEFPQQTDSAPAQHAQPSHATTEPSAGTKNTPNHTVSVADEGASTSQDDRKQAIQALNGSWTFHSREGQFEEMLVAMGVSMLKRKVLLAITGLTMEVDLGEGQILNLTMLSSLRNVVKPPVQLDGTTVTRDKNVVTGDDMEVTGQWDGSTIVLNKRNLKFPERNLIEKRFVEEGRHVVEVTVPAKNLVYREIFARQP